MEKQKDIPPSGLATTIRLPAELISFLKEMAAEHGLTMHSYVRMVLTHHVKEYRARKEKENA